MSERVSLESNVVGVTVYRSGARVIRSAELVAKAEGFPTEVVLPDLPLTLEDGSVQVRVDATDPEAPVACDFGVVLEPVPESLEPAESLRQALCDARKNESASLRRLERLQGFAARLTQVKLVPRPRNKWGAAPIESPTDSRLAWLEFRRNRVASLRSRIETLEEAHRELVERRKALEAEVRQSSNARAPRAAELRKALHVVLDASRSSATSAVLVVEYLVPGARWSPSYSLSLARKTGAVTLFLRAVVAQKTGEDWRGVDIALSTALPQRFSALPELKALKVGKRQLVPPQSLRPAPSPEDLYADYDAVLAAEPMPEEEIDIEAAADSFTGGELAEPPEVERPIPLIPGPLAGAPAPAMAVASSPVSDFIMGAASKQKRGGLARSAPTQEITDEPPEPTIASELMDYGNLRMPPPGAPSRGRVAPLSAAARYLELWARQETAITIDVTQMIHLAVEEARTVEAIPLPTSHREPTRPVGFDYTYRGAHHVDIPSDGRYHTILLRQSEASAALHHVCVPREAPEVFRCLRFVNPFDAPLLPGPVEVTVDGRYLTPGEIEAAPRDGEVEVWIGAEQRIHAARNTSYREAVSGLLRGHITLEHAISVELISHLEKAVEVEVRERIPVPRENDDEVEVELREVTPEWRPFEQPSQPLKGGYSWTVTLSPGEKRQLSARYAVLIPAKHQLVGGNRREA